MAQYLLANGLKNFEGVVFLDEFDRKMILVRATGRVLKLAQCGISEKKRFAFYDQVHTTGMDIKHVLSACAVLTLGKDMTFRDYAQGKAHSHHLRRLQSIHSPANSCVSYQVRSECVESARARRSTSTSSLKSSA